MAIEQEIARQCRLLRTVRAWRTEAEAACALMGRFELEAKLGFLLGMFKDKIEGEIVKNLDALLAEKLPAAKKITRKKA